MVKIFSLIRILIIHRYSLCSLHPFFYHFVDRKHLWFDVHVQSLLCEYYILGSYFDKAALAWEVIRLEYDKLINICLRYALNVKIRAADANMQRSKWRRYRVRMKHRVLRKKSQRKSIGRTFIVIPFVIEYISLLPVCMLLSLYVMFIYLCFMLFMSDNSPCSYCYLLTIPTLNIFYLILSYLILWYMKEISNKG